MPADLIAALREPDEALCEAAAKAHCWALGCEACSTWQECGWITTADRRRNLDQARIVLGVVAGLLEAHQAPQEGRPGDGALSGGSKSETSSESPENRPSGDFP